MKYFLFAILFMLSLVSLSQAQGEISSDFHKNTMWNFKTSIKYDALCFINIMTGDPFYVKYYEKDYETFSKKITPEVKVSLDNLQKVKENTGIVLSAGLCLYFSASTDSTLDQLIYTTRDLSDLKNTFSKTVYYKENEWALFESIQEDLRECFIFLKEAGFEEYWNISILPKIEKKMDELQEQISASNYNIIIEQEKLLGVPLLSNIITVDLLYYAQPHGMKIISSEFITDIAYSFSVLLHTAAHEMMHPPYDLATNIPLQKALVKLKEDPFLMDKVVNHNPSYGYNNFESYIEENCVRALDQIVSEKIGQSNGPEDRWKKADEGMHVFANALYQVMKEESFNNNNELFADFLIRMISEGKFKPGIIEKRFNAIETN